MAYKSKFRFSPAAELIPSTFRDHTGGLNLVDNEQNLDIRFQTSLKNCYRNATGALAIRYGTRLFCDITGAIPFPITADDNFVILFAESTPTTLVFSRGLHNLVTGDQITFSGFTAPVNGVPYASINGTHTVTVLNDSWFQITVASYTATLPTTLSDLSGLGYYNFPNETMTGSIINITYFNNKLIVVTSDGIVAAVSGAGALEVIWDNPLARVSQQSTTTFATTNAQAGASTTFSITLTGYGAYGTVTLSGTNTTAATDGATLASLLQTALRTADGGTTRISVTWSSDVLTITDSVGRDWSGGSLDGGGGAAAYTNPVFWSTGIEFVSFAEFGAELYIANGVDKPIIVHNDMTVDYVVDLATGSNANTPICRYVCAADDYLLMAGDPTAQNTLYISNKRAGGTWEGDAAPNDAITIDLSKKAGTSIIKGLARFRNLVCVVFDDRIVFGTLGTYNDTGDHVPVFDDVIEQVGGVSHRTLITTGDELLVCDNNGVPSVAQAVLTQTLRPKRPSYIVAPELKANLRVLSEGALEDRVFAVWNRNEDQYMLFIPNSTTKSETTETICWVYTTNPSEKLSHWSRFRDWNFNCACISKLNRLFLCTDDRIYVYGTTDDPITADFVNDPDITAPDDGEEIDFEIEWPWVDLGERVKKKKCRFLQLETTGTARFTMKMYVDNIETDVNGSDNPTIQMQFVGGDSGGYGAGTQPYGGGRRSSDERPWRWISDFKIAKLAITGSTREPLGIISVSLIRINTEALK